MNEISNWIPAVTTASVMTAIGWLARSFIITRLTKSVQSKFDLKLEVLKSELKTKEAQIESLRTGAMSGLIMRQSVLYQRKIEAIDQIWSAIVELEKAKFISATMAGLKFEECSAESAKSSRFRTAFEIIGGSFKPDNLDFSGASKARPFITPLAWAYYSAYSSVIMLAVAKLQILKFGVENGHKFFKSDSSSKLLKTVLPSRSSYIDEHGTAVHHYLLDDIEQLLLMELQNIQSGQESDKENARRAIEINKEVEKVTNEVEKVANEVAKKSSR